MTQPLYFLPHVRSGEIAPGGNLDHTKLKDYGVADVFRDVEGQMKDCAVGDIICGPDGHSGTLLIYQATDGSFPENIQYRDDSQKWEKVSDKIYIGIDTQSPPIPTDLLRKRVAHGNLLAVESGNVIVPIVRRRAGTSSLNIQYLMTEEGVIQRVDETEVPLWDLGAKVLEWIHSGHLSQADQVDQVEAAVKIIGRNYRYGIHEQNLLGWVTPENFLTILAWAIDLPNEPENVEFSGIKP